MTNAASRAGGRVAELRLFRGLALLAKLNIVGVGAAIATGVAVVLPTAFNETDLGFALAMAVPSFVIGAWWAKLLRSPRKFGKTDVRVGWVASVPLAILNAAIACGISYGLRGSVEDVIGRFLGAALLGATVGAIVWVPALLAILMLFGFPIARAQELARRGLAGEERGEWIVGLASLTVALGGVALLAPVHGLELGSVIPPSADPAAAVSYGFASLALAAAGSATVLAVLREARRRRFVKRARAGEVAGYRVDATKEGQVLMRVESEGKGYRVADFEEELVELDHEGAATRAVA